MVKFRELEYTTSDSEQDPDYDPGMDMKQACSGCCESFALIEDLNETIFNLTEKNKKLKQDIRQLRKIILTIANEIKNIC